MSIAINFSIRAFERYIQALYQYLSNRGKGGSRAVIYLASGLGYLFGSYYRLRQDGRAGGANGVQQRPRINAYENDAHDHYT